MSKRLSSYSYSFQCCATLQLIINIACISLARRHNYKQGVRVIKVLDQNTEFGGDTLIYQIFSSQ